jgi:hypothetical protein
MNCSPLELGPPTSILDLYGCTKTDRPVIDYIYSLGQTCFHSLGYELIFVHISCRVKYLDARLLGEVDTDWRLVRPSAKLSEKKGERERV